MFYEISFRLEEAQANFVKISKVIKVEIDFFERYRVKDFKNAIILYLVSWSPQSYKINLVGKKTKLVLNLLTVHYLDLFTPTPFSSFDIEWFVLATKIPFT